MNFAYNVLNVYRWSIDGVNVFDSITITVLDNHQRWKPFWNGWLIRAKIERFECFSNATHKWQPLFMRNLGKFSAGNYSIAHSFAIATQFGHSGGNVKIQSICLCCGLFCNLIGESFENINLYRSALIRAGNKCVCVCVLNEWLFVFAKRWFQYGIRFVSAGQPWMENSAIDKWYERGQNEDETVQKMCAHRPLTPKKKWEIIHTNEKNDERWFFSVKECHDSHRIGKRHRIRAAAATHTLIHTAIEEKERKKKKEKKMSQVEIDLNVKRHCIRSGKHHMPNGEVNNTLKKIDCLYFSIKQTYIKIESPAR